MTYTTEPLTCPDAMHIRYSFLVLLVTLNGSLAISQEVRDLDNHAQSPWVLQRVSTSASFRGLHVLDAQRAWASGTGGTVVRTEDGGKTWSVSTIEGAENLDIRDIHAIDDHTIVAMTSGTPARIYRATDGGKAWNRVYESTDRQVFLDAVSFLSETEGIVMGDPIGGKLFLLHTLDGGLSWQCVEDAPHTLPHEAGFAASGTNMTTVGANTILIGLGGGADGDAPAPSRIAVLDWTTRNATLINTPLPRGPASGIFSIAFRDPNHGVAVGGDYQLPEATRGNFAITQDGGKTWIVPENSKPPTGYRSCVAIKSNHQAVDYVAVGTNGTDLSTDGGRSWQRISDHGFNAAAYSADGKLGVAVGSEGRIAIWQELTQ